MGLIDHKTEIMLGDVAWNARQLIDYWMPLMHFLVDQEIIEDNDNRPIHYPFGLKMAADFIGMKPGQMLDDEKITLIKQFIGPHGSTMLTAYKLKKEDHDNRTLLQTLGESDS